MPDLTEAVPGVSSRWAKIIAWSSLVILGAGVFGGALLATMPVRVAIGLAGINIPIERLAGTVLHGQGQLDASHLVLWTVQPWQSVLMLAIVADVQISGSETNLLARVAITHDQVTAGPVTGQAAWPLVASLVPNLTIQCKGVADVRIDTAAFISPRTASGQIFIASGSCDRIDGAVTGVPVPSLLAKVSTVEDGIEIVVTHDTTPLAKARLTNADRALVTIHPAGAMLVPGMPSSADTTVDLPLALLK